VAGVADLADGAEVLVLVGEVAGAEASVVGVADLEDGLEDLVVGAVDLVAGVAELVLVGAVVLADGALIHSGTHSGAVVLAVGVADSVAGVDGTLTLLDTGTHTDPFITVEV